MLDIARPPREELPRFLSPAACRARELPSGDGWAAEVKRDGCAPRSGSTSEFPELAGLAYALRGRRVLLDGKLVCLGADDAQHGLEGAVAKRLDSPWIEGRWSSCWVKVKHRRREVFVTSSIRVAQK